MALFRHHVVINEIAQLDSIQDRPHYCEVKIIILMSMIFKKFKFYLVDVFQVKIYL